MDDEDRFKLVGICVGCFGGGYPEGGTHCYDCGAGGSVFLLPAWAVKEIRRHDQGRLALLGQYTEELRMLRSKVGLPEEASVSPYSPQGGWNARHNGIIYGLGDFPTREEAEAYATERVPHLSRERLEHHRRTYKDMAVPEQPLREEIRTMGFAERSVLRDMALHNGLNQLLKAIGEVEQ